MMQLKSCHLMTVINGRKMVRILIWNSIIFFTKSLRRLNISNNSKRIFTGSSLIMSSFLVMQATSSNSPAHSQPQPAIDPSQLSFDLTDLTKSIDHTAISDDHSLAPTDDYVRIDQSTWNSPEFAKFKDNNALHDTLNGNGMIEIFQVYQSTKTNDIYAIVKFGHRLNGYPGLIHGGISSLVIDTLFGWTFMAQKLPSAFTANLTVNYRKPIYENSTVIVKSRMVKQDGRKIFMESTIEDGTSKEVLVEATTLFITAKK